MKNGEVVCPHCGSNLHLRKYGFWDARQKYRYAEALSQIRFLPDFSSQRSLICNRAKPAREK